MVITKTQKFDSPRESMGSFPGGVMESALPDQPMLTLINPTQRAEPFDHADWVFEAKFDGFRAAVDTVRGRLISRNGNWVRRFEWVLDLLPRVCVFDGESRPDHPLASQSNMVNP
jgi:ATP-dependent DNA ligase